MNAKYVKCPQCGQDEFLRCRFLFLGSTWSFPFNRYNEVKEEYVNGKVYCASCDEYICTYNELFDGSYDEND